MDEGHCSVDVTGMANGPDPNHSRRYLLLLICALPAAVASLATRPSRAERFHLGCKRSGFSSGRVFLHQSNSRS